MASIDAWTEAVRGQHNNSVLLAVPASSHPLSGGTSLEIAFEAIADGGVIGAALAAGAIAVATARSGFRRVKNRRKPVGEREVNDRVALLFYEDRVDVHGRRAVGKQVGSLRSSHPLSEVHRPEASKLVVGQTQWTLTANGVQSLSGALEAAGIELLTPPIE